MIRRLFVYFAFVISLCFIISCKKDSPSADSVKKELKNASESARDDDLVIRDDTASVTDTVKQKIQSQWSEDSVICETNTDNATESITHSDMRVYDVAEKLPEFPGGLKALTKYISEQSADILSSIPVKKPTRTMVSLIVEKDGTLSDIRIARSSGNIDLDNAALKIVESMPVWTPAQNDGTDVRMKYVVPVNFNPQH